MLMRRYQQVNEKIPTGECEDTNRLMRRYQHVNEKIPTG
jgi:hypothetical protein